MTTVFVALGTGELLPGRLEREFRADYSEGWAPHEPRPSSAGLMFVIYVMRTKLSAQARDSLRDNRPAGWLARQTRS